MKVRAISQCAVIVLGGLMACTSSAWAYPVGPALSLEKLTEEADIIFRGTVVASGPVEDGWFKPYQDFVARETQFKLISVLKGERPGDRLLFRHYDEDPRPRGRMFQPQYYHFDAGRTYIVFAKKGGAAGVFRQLWMYHKSKEDQGILLCVNDKAADAKTVKDALWAELTVSLGSTSSSDVIYAIGQIDQMSAGQGQFGGLSDFDRKDAVAAVRALMANRDIKIAAAVIGLIGSHNPYMSDERTLYWLATVGSAEIPGIGKMDPKMKNVGGELCSKELLALADSKVPGETRALAVRALGLVREPSLEKSVEHWVADPSPAVRASAAVLLADFPSPETRQRLTAMADDAASEVRACVARAIGFGQQAELADILAKLLADQEVKVRNVAAMSLLSFSPKNDTIAKVFRANLENEEFKPLFLIALAKENPTAHLDALAVGIEQRSEPKNFWGGQIPAFTAWGILFKHLQAQPAETIRSGKLDRYLDAIEKVGNYSSSEPRDIYAFYVQRGMNERAKKFRQDAKRAASYDLDYFFNQVDENPSLYKRE